MDEQIHSPSALELPTTKQLNKATLIAAGVAAALLFTTVLPAEYGYDPTGIGRVLGLTPMGEMKRAEAAGAVAEDAVADEAATEDIVMDAAPTPSAAPTSVAAGQQGEVTLTLAPNEGKEVKATMRAGAELRYEWSTGGPRVNFELHGEEPGSTDFTSYEKGSSAGESGTFRAPFDGTHGWYWKNRTASPITITVRATGNFEKFERLGS